MCEKACLDPDSPFHGNQVREHDRAIGHSSMEHLPRECRVRKTRDGVPILFMMAEALLSGSEPIVAQAVLNIDDIQSHIVKNILSLCNPDPRLWRPRLLLLMVTMANDMGQRPAQSNSANSANSANAANAANDDDVEMDLLA